MVDIYSQTQVHTPEETNTQGMRKSDGKLINFSNSCLFCNQVEIPLPLRVCLMDDFALRTVILTTTISKRQRRRRILTSNGLILKFQSDGWQFVVIASARRSGW